MSKEKKLGTMFKEFFYGLYGRIVEFFGILLSFFAMATVVALVSYCHEDPSLNTAIDGAASNILSLPGSYYADIMMQFFGSSSYVFSVVLVSFGYQLMKYRHLSFVRVVSCFVAIASASLMITTSGSRDAHLSAGVIGNLLLGLFGKNTYTINSVDIPVVLVAASIVFAIALTVSMRLYLSSFSAIKTFIANFSNKLFSNAAVKISDLKDGIANRAKQDKTLIAMSDSQESSATVKKTQTQKKSASPHANTSGKFVLPPLNLLKEAQSNNEKLSDSEVKSKSQNLMSVLNDFGINGEISGASPGPVVTLYELKPAAGIKSSRVIGLSSDIARYMSAVSARVAVIPGRNALGIELPNTKRQTVYLRETLESSVYTKSTNALPISLGKDISGGPIVADLAKMPHLLIAGTTGSGKSVGINAMILSLLYKLSPDECKFIMIDPKMLELSVYDDIPHLLTPVVTDPKKAVTALKWAVREMETRYKAMSKLGVRNIDGYNTKISALKVSGENVTRRVHTGFDQETGAPIYEDQVMEMDLLPYIVVIVDEMADLMLVAGKDIEVTVQRLAQMARAAGIHLIMATQRPSVDVITGTIKANFPTRISFLVSSKIDSRTILGEQGAEQLLGQGDMLYMASGGRMVRIHCPFVSDSEVEKIASYLKTQGEPKYITSILEEEDGADSDSDSQGTDGDDPMYKDAVNLILREGKASTSFLQRHLKIGYNRAARIIDMMEAAGIVSPANHAGKREIIGR